MSHGAPFPDHFSTVASDYSAYRPHYPASLFDTLATIAAEALPGSSPRESGIAWDCAAGTGQASLALGDRFRHVLATDASASQIAEAPRHDHVHYCVALAEACPLGTGSVSLVTVAQALHWFDVTAFHAEAKRVLMPDGVIAVWTYALPSVDMNPAVTRLIAEFSEDTLGPWWPPERRHVDAGYASLPFPFERVTVPPAEMTATWTASELVGYVRTWSAVSQKRAATGVDPVDEFETALGAVWNAPSLTLRWPLTVLVGRR